MVLVDVSSILHRMLFGSTKDASKIRKENGKYITEDFIFLTLHYILSELIDIKNKHREYGQMVLCFDDYKKAYWRRDIFPEYKLKRRVSTQKEENPINYQEVYDYTNRLFEQLKVNTPWKCMYVNRAEADDIILVLAKEFHKEGILILSPDKDFLQSQRVPNVRQYSALTKKWLLPENKNDNMKQWIIEHVLLGDDSDGVPKVVDQTEFSENFKNHLLKFNMPTTVKAFKAISLNEKREALETYDIKTYNRKGEETGFDIFKTSNFGPSNIEKIKNGTWDLKKREENIKKSIADLRILKKTISNKDEAKKIQNKIKQLLLDKKNLQIIPKTEEERISNFLDSHELYREHYNRNIELVMEEGIPDYIRTNILMEYNRSDTAFNEDEFIKYLDENNLGTIKTKIPLVFKSDISNLDITNHGWDL